MISNEAVESAARAIYPHTNLSFDDTYEHIRERCRGQARAALEAAAPYMLAGAWEEGGRAAVGHYDTGYPITNPYMLNNEGEK